MELHIFTEKEIPITSPDKWREYAPPLNPGCQWKDYRSAKELAKSVENATLAPLLEKVLNRFNYPVPTEMDGVPEKATKLPWGRSGDRKHDLLLEYADKSLIIGIEAKADEPFDNSIEKKRLDSRKNADGGANMSKRLDGILNFIYGSNLPKNKEALMYQLLSATAGVILEASNNNLKYACALFLVFESKNLDKQKLEKNENDWKDFCKSLNIDENGGVITIEGIRCLIVKEQIHLT